MKKKFSYHTGISDERADWVWQGKVVAKNAIHARKLLVKFKKKKKLTGTSEILRRAQKTKRKIGVSSL